MMIVDAPPTPGPRRAGRLRLREVAIFAALAGLVVLGLLGLAASTGWDETLAALSRLGSTEVAILLGLSLVNYLARALRWHLFSRRLGLPLGPAASFRHFLGGFLMTITPARVGELVRMRWIGRETGWPFERTAPLVLVDRAADLAAMAILMALAILLAATSVEGAAPVAVLALATAIVATRPWLLAKAATFGHAVLGRGARVFARARRAARSLAAFDAPLPLAAAGVLGVVGWMAEGAAFWLLLHWMGADLGFWTATGIFVFATLAGGLTGAPGGLGGAEAAMVVLTMAQGVPAGIAVPATLVVRVTTLWFAIAIGALVFPFAEAHARRGLNALED